MVGKVGRRVVAASADDSINIPPGTYTLLLGSEITIRQNLTMTGAGALETIIQAAAEPDLASHRVFNITGGNVAISDVTIRYGTSTVNGGGIYNSASTLTLTNSTISNNSSRGHGGGISAQSSGTLTLVNSTVSGNTSTQRGGGGIFNQSGALTLADSTVSGNSAHDRGGGVSSGGTLTITNSTVSGNVAQDAGGIFNQNGTLTLTNSIVSGNSADREGGGIHGWGTMTIGNSTISDNTASFGGGIFFARTLTIANSTISGNTATNRGGGIYSVNITLTLTNNTVSGNVAQEGGGIYNDSGIVEMVNTIVAVNTSPTGPNCSGQFTSRGYNLIEDVRDCNFTPVIGDLVGTEDSLIDPQLGPLQENGANIFTHALLEDSPAIDHIPVADCKFATDQRGVLRPQGGGCDVGAFEVEPGPTPAPTTAPAATTAPVTPAAVATPTPAATATPEPEATPITPLPVITLRQPPLPQHSNLQLLRRQSQPCF